VIQGHVLWETWRYWIEPFCLNSRIQHFGTFGIKIVRTREEVVEGKSHIYT
jgi:hypothetical protein